MTSSAPWGSIIDEGARPRTLGLPSAGAAGGLAEGGKQNQLWTSHFHQEEPGPFRTEAPDPVPDAPWRLPQSVAQEHPGESTRGQRRLATHADS